MGCLRSCSQSLVRTTPALEEVAEVAALMAGPETAGQSCAHSRAQSRRAQSHHAPSMRLHGTKRGLDGPCSQACVAPATRVTPQGEDCRRAGEAAFQTCRYKGTLYIVPFTSGKFLFQTRSLPTGQQVNNCRKTPNHPTPNIAELRGRTCPKRRGRRRDAEQSPASPSHGHRVASSYGRRAVHSVLCNPCRALSA